jgi:hypothetical protein
MFLLNGNPLSPDVAFTGSDGTQYPANWLRLASPEERLAVGITEQPAPPVFDQRFYWDTGIPKDHSQLVPQWIDQTRATAGTLLAPTDWQVIREADNGTPVPADVKTWREAIRLASNEKVIYLGTTNTTEELAAYVTGAEYPVWPSSTPAPVVAPVVDVLSFDGGSTSSGVMAGSPVF